MVVQKESIQNFYGKHHGLKLCKQSRHKRNHDINMDFRETCGGGSIWLSTMFKGMVPTLQIPLPDRHCYCYHLLPPYYIKSKVQIKNRHAHACIHTHSHTNICRSTLTHVGYIWSLPTECAVELTEPNTWDKNYNIMCVGYSRTLVAASYPSSHNATAITTLLLLDIILFICKRKARSNNLTCMYNPVERSPFWETNSCSARQVISRLLQNTKVYRSVHNSLQLDPILNKMNPSTTWHAFTFMVLLCNKLKKKTPWL